MGGGGQNRQTTEQNRKNQPGNLFKATRGTGGGTTHGEQHGNQDETQLHDDNWQIEESKTSSSDYKTGSGPQSKPLQPKGQGPSWQIGPNFAPRARPTPEKKKPATKFLIQRGK